MFRSVGDHLLNTVEFGTGEPALLGVGGWIGNWELWQQPFEVLSRSHRCIAYDHQGAGESPVEPDAISFEAQVRTVFELMDAFQMQPCVLLGESNGGAVAIEAVLRQPERFNALVLIDSPTWGWDNPETRGFVQALRSNFKSTIDAFVNLCTPEPEVEHVRRWVRNILLKAEPEVAARLLECMYGLDLRPRLGELRLPTLVIQGELDAIRFVRLSRAEENVSLMLQARLHVVRGAGHVPTLTRPAEVTEAIEQFLAQLTLGV